MIRSALQKPKLDSGRIAATATLLPVFAAFFIMLLVLLPPNAGNHLAADPLVQWFIPAGGAGLIAVVALVFGAAWWLACKPPAAALAEASRYAVAGVMAGLLLPFLVRQLYGDTLPAFIPPEESSAPGLALGVGAGLIEESLFRLGVLPLSFLLLQRHLGTSVAAAVACVLTGLAFALSHETGAFDAAHFTTRLLLPGIAMSVIAAAIHPAFMVAAHIAAHVGIAVLFVTSAGIPAG